MAEVGYIRVSSAGQNTDRQLDGIPLDKIFEEKVSGKSFNRPQLTACINYLRDGDTLHVHSMDRLARNLSDLQKLVEDLTGQGITVRFSKESLEFNGQDNPMGKLMMQIMGAVAEFERSLIRERQAEGIKKALAKGIKFGREEKLSAVEKREVIALSEAGKTKALIAKRYRISRTTVYKILKERADGKIHGPAEAQLDLVS